MELEAETLAFLSSPVLLMLSAADADRRPAIGRGIGLEVIAPDDVAIFISRWQWPQVVRNIASSGRLAVTASRANDYLTYQVKGAATIGEATSDDVDRARRYWDAINETLARDHVPPHIVAQWSADRDMMVARLRIAEAYVQTPGPHAGTSL